ncbi:hypothetical protein [Rugamonas sp.]|uniref:hypothetical protein n=1 Tax=Rugamonas sp. TaxID=1926287 RepID=UPI0025EB8B38|nr:hypothetical protein [Rugamonas sp.]
MKKLVLALQFIGDVVTPVLVYNLCILGGITMIAAGVGMLLGAAASLICTGALLIVLTLHMTVGFGGKE